jgi:acyl-CoA thioester hydrolase
MISSELKVRVRYVDVDQMGIVYHTRYFDWCEWGRTELLREIGTPYRELENQGISLPVSEAFLKYRKGAKYDEWVRVKSFLREIPKASIKIEYEIVDDPSGEMIATGYTIHAFIIGKKTTRVTKNFLENLSRYWKD